MSLTAYLVRSLQKPPEQPPREQPPKSDSKTTKKVQKVAPEAIQSTTHRNTHNATMLNPKRCSKQASALWSDSEKKLLKEYYSNPKDPRTWEEFITSLPGRTILGTIEYARSHGYEKKDRPCWHMDLMKRLIDFSKKSTSREDWSRFLDQFYFKRYDFTVNDYLLLAESKKWIVDPTRSEHVEAYLNELLPLIT